MAKNLALYISSPERGTNLPNHGNKNSKNGKQNCEEPVKISVLDRYPS